LKLTINRELNCILVPALTAVGRELPRVVLDSDPSVLVNVCGVRGVGSTRVALALAVVLDPLSGPSGASGESGSSGFRFGSGLGGVGGFGCGATGGVTGLGATGAGAGAGGAGRGAGAAGATGAPRRIGGIGTPIAHVVDVAPSKRSRSAENSIVDVNVGCECG
jgi:hypothetical protein